MGNRPADVVTVFEAQQGQGHADRAGGLGYLTELAHRTPSAANIARYAEIVRDRALLRELLAEFCDSVDARARGSGEMAIPTGLNSLDTALNGGLRQGNLVIVAGRPSMGKTALTTDIGLNMSATSSGRGMPTSSSAPLVCAAWPGTTRA
ncbi:DnaB-like helicase C-terminal domain-containing protein [Cupriavidus sp. 2MCAB6]|uniref:DnaB-like helicase C-terminal domain-containing protein n=1 Tax=Cupriavidus sp. 2MCAB6 TaxID=3232981 RepID=UPI003F914DD9